MRHRAKATRHNRTITADFCDESTYFQVLSDGQAFVEFVLAFILALGFQRTHKPTCRGGGCLTRHSHYARVRLGGLTLWRIQCTTCKAVFTVLPHFVLRYRTMRPAVARAAREPEPSYHVRGALTDGFDRTTKSLRTLFPGARLGCCRRHALHKLPDKLSGVSASVRQGWRSKCHALLHRCRQRTSLRVVALGQRLRSCAAHIATTVGDAPGTRVRQWCQAKTAGWYAVLADPQMPARSTGLDQAHNAIDRQLFAMKGCHHPRGSQAAFLTGLAPLYHCIPSQRRALHAG